MKCFQSRALIVLFMLTFSTVPASLAQNFQVLYAFPGCAAGRYPGGGLLPLPNGNLIGAAAGGACEPYGSGLIYELTPAGTEIVVYTFNGSDGDGPVLAFGDGSGGVYGTTSGGGTSGNGTIFHLDSSGHLQTLYSFKGNPDASDPGGLTRDAAGNFYGDSYIGGAHNAGTVFKLDKNGKESVIYSFTGVRDGALPSSWSLIIDNTGNIYGTTFAGGTSGCFGGGCGVVYKINAAGKETVLHFFSDKNGGGTAPKSLLQDSNGNLYGSTTRGGNPACEGGCGTLFELSPSGAIGWKEKTLYEFEDGNDGSGALGPLFFNNAGDILGTTGDSLYQCSGSACGTVFDLSQKGLKTIYTFQLSDGEAPFLWFSGNSGTFYGTTLSGGDLECIDDEFYGCGTVFSISP